VRTRGGALLCSGGGGEEEASPHTPPLIHAGAKRSALL
jgi:hypothetical protein